MNHRHADVLLVTLLRHREREWLDIERLADEAGLTLDETVATLRELHSEYGAVRILPLTQKVQLVFDGLERYQEETQ